MSVREMFDAELRRRGLTFSIDADSGRHVIELSGGRMLVCLDNLQREFERYGDVGRVPRFVDAIVASSLLEGEAFSVDRLYWCLEHNEYEQPPDFRVPVSRRVDRVLVHLSQDDLLIKWATADMLNTLGITEPEVGRRAFKNLARALEAATMHSDEINGVPLVMIGSTLPFKSSLILAPNLKELVGSRVGWPLIAVAPDRDFLYLWAAEHRDFVQRVGRIVVREYLQSSYHLSTEVYQIDDDGVRAIGVFPTEEHGNSENRASR